MTIGVSGFPLLTFARWQQDIVAGLIVGILALPICLAAGTLAFAPLGTDFVAVGAAAGLYGAIVAGAVTALVAFAGFINGAALLIIKAQIKPFFVDGTGSTLLLPKHLPTLAFVVCLALLAIFHMRLATKLALPPWVAKVPGTIVAFALGIIAFHLAKWLVPALDIGSTIGQPDIKLASPLMSVWEPNNAAHIWTAGWHVLTVSVVLAIVASLESLMSLRLAQNIADIEVHPTRDLAAQGCGNCATALLTGIASAATPGLLVAAFRARGRTRLTGIMAAVFILVLGVMFSDAIAAIPNSVLSAVLLAMGVMMFDAGSIRLFGEVVRNSSPLARNRAVYDLLIIATVMGITVMTTIVIGVIGGCLLSGIIFVINMSRPVVRHSYRGGDIFSKRIRSAEDFALLQATGSRRAVLQLEGVLFFGNAEELSRQVKQLFEHADMVVLDMRAITDIDVSGFNILGSLVTRSRERGKQLLFCNVSVAQTAIVRKLFDRPESADAAIKMDMESALEWMEEETLRNSLDERSRSRPLALEETDFLEGVSEQELAQLRQVLKLREFKPGNAICHEGEPGDKMWLLVKGSVSVRLNVDDSRVSRRIASLGRGTVFGEMALIDGARRSATIVADEDVSCYELNSDDFATLLRDKPYIAARIMRNTARELARRLRRTSEDLRHATS
jgi:SulP family sulfate permease